MTSDLLVVVLNVVTVAIGVYLVGTGIRAIAYFRQQEKLMGTNWVHHSFYRTCVVITAVYAILLAYRLAVLILAPPIEPPDDPIRTWGGITVYAALIWLGLKPDRLRRQFKKHEGR